MPQERRTAQNDMGKMALTVLKGVGIGLAVSLMILLLGTLAVSGSLVSDTFGRGLGLLAVAAGSFAGGLWAALRLKSRVLWVSLAVGGGLLLLWCLLAMVPTLDREGDLLSLALSALGGSGLSGILAASAKKRKR